MTRPSRHCIRQHETSGITAATAACHHGDDRPWHHLPARCLPPQVTHPDLAASMWVNPHEQADGLDNDGTGYADDFNGWDFLNNDK